MKKTIITFGILIALVTILWFVQIAVASQKSGNLDLMAPSTDLSVLLDNLDEDIAETLDSISDTPDNDEYIFSASLKNENQSAGNAGIFLLGMGLIGAAFMGRQLGGDDR